MKPTEGVIWVKGWFDGDFTAVAPSGSDISRDKTSDQVVITRGRLSAIERVDGPPPTDPATTPLFQRSVPMVHLDQPGSEGWITQVYDLQIPQWTSVTTGSAEESTPRQSPGPTCPGPRHRPAPVLRPCRHPRRHPHRPAPSGRRPSLPRRPRDPARYAAGAGRWSCSCCCGSHAA